MQVTREIGFCSVSTIVDLDVDDVLGFALSYKSTTLLVNKQKEAVL
jgi:hypothetical protein